MEYHEFVCVGTPAIKLVAATADVGGLPNVAKQLVREWGHVRTFKLGDGVYSATQDEAINAQVAAVGYYLFVERPDEAQGKQKPEPGLRA